LSHPQSTSCEYGQKTCKKAEEEDFHITTIGRQDWLKSLTLVVQGFIGIAFYVRSNFGNFFQTSTI